MLNECFIKHRSLHLLIPNVNVRYERWIKITYHMFLVSPPAFLWSFESLEIWHPRLILNKTTSIYNVSVQGFSASNSADGPPVLTSVFLYHWTKLAGGFEPTREKRNSHRGAGTISARRQNVPPQKHLVYYTRNDNKNGAKSIFSSQEPLGFISNRKWPKEVTGSGMGARRTWAHTQWRTLAPR